MHHDKGPFFFCPHAYLQLMTVEHRHMEMVSNHFKKTKPCRELGWLCLYTRLGIGVPSPLLLHLTCGRDGREILIPHLPLPLLFPPSSAVLWPPWLLLGSSPTHNINHYIFFQWLLHRYLEKYNLLKDFLETCSSLSYMKLTLKYMWKTTSLFKVIWCKLRSICWKCSFCKGSILLANCCVNCPSKKIKKTIWSMWYTYNC